MGTWSRLSADRLLLRQVDRQGVRKYEMLHTCLAPVIEKEGITMSLVADTAMPTMAQLLQQRRLPT
jgi:hypothetical protein